jgi:hypothetical protein
MHTLVSLLIFIARRDHAAEFAIGPVRATNKNETPPTKRLYYLQWLAWSC